MNWLPATGHGYAQYSADRRYSVVRYSVGGETRYEAWRTRQHDAGPRLVQTRLPSADAARAAAEADAAEFGQA